MTMAIDMWHSIDDCDEHLGLALALLLGRNGQFGFVEASVAGYSVCWPAGSDIYFCSNR